jgi:hypothetical protein
MICLLQKSIDLICQSLTIICSVTWSLITRSSSSSSTRLAAILLCCCCCCCCCCWASAAVYAAARGRRYEVCRLAGWQLRQPQQQVATILQQRSTSLRQACLSSLMQAGTQVGGRCRYYHQIVGCDLWLHRCNRGCLPLRTLSSLIQPCHTAATCCLQNGRNIYKRMLAR